MDKATLFKSRLPEDDVEIPGVGTVRVRALNHKEAIHVQGAEDTPGERERRLLAQGLVDPMLMDPVRLHDLGDKPCVKCAEAGQWQKAAPADELVPVMERITQLSGMGDKAAKEAFKEFETDSDAEFPVLPGTEAVDDGVRPGQDAAS